MRVLVVLLLLISLSTSASNYVVIGAFAKESNAIKLSRKIDAQYEINPVKQLFYVYVLKTEISEAAFIEARKLQGGSEYKDAWVFVGTLGVNGKGEDVLVPVLKDEPAPAITSEPVIVQPEPTPVPAAPVNSNSKNFFFSVTYESGSPAPGEVTIIEPKSQRKEYVFNGNENVVMKPISPSGDMRVECDLVGYRKIVQSINYQTPDSTDGVTIKDNKVIVPFMLVRLKKGDHQILYNVLFYKDAAIMRPESKVDLEGVLAMMQENSRYKIRIHGHTNGSSAGKIIEAGESGDLFSLGGAKEGAGTAKKLSQRRAEVIRDYLAKSGVDPTRMTIKAWGGKKPIYDKMHTQAYANVRVEVEVLED